MLKNLHQWLPSYIASRLTAQEKPLKGKPVNVAFCFVDHFEPCWNKATYEDEVRRIDTWVREYPKLVEKHFDSKGRHPQHTFFYPQEQYRKEHLDKLAKLCKAGYGDVEIHLHHDNDTAEALKNKLETFKKQLHSHGLLSVNEKGVIEYGFIHGNWALDNSRKDGRWCGVNNEIQVLKETGCYADFTMPSAPHETQTKKINSIYYATGAPGKPKSHNSGVDVEVGKPPSGDLMIIQGPLALNWKARKWGLIPKIENGDITGANPPTPERIDIWVKQHIHVKGEPNWIFVKIHTHGTQERHHASLFGEAAGDMYSYLENKYNDGINYRLHYMASREMYSVIKKIEQ